MCTIVRRMKLFVFGAGPVIYLCVYMYMFIYTCRSSGRMKPCVVRMKPSLCGAFMCIYVNIYIYIYTCVYVCV